MLAPYGGRASVRGQTDWLVSVIGRRVLITGATGFVGRHVVPVLLDADHDLTLALRSDVGCPPKWLNHPRIKAVVVGDLADATLHPTALAGVRAVVHLAGLAGARSHVGAPFQRANVLVTQRLAESARHFGISTFIHLSSVMAVTGNGSNAVIDDVTPPRPETAYGCSKREAELALAEVADPTSLSISLRAPMIIGADAKGNWARLQRLAASGVPLPFASVRRPRSLIGVDFLASLIAQLVRENWPPGLSGNYAVASLEPLPLPDMLRELRRGMGAAPRLVPFPPEVLRALAPIIGMKRQITSLTSGLQLDPSRFFETFGLAVGPSVREAIRQSGAIYLAMRQGSR